MTFGCLLRATVLLSAGVVFASASARADERQKVLDAAKWAEKIMVGTCDFPLLKDGGDLTRSGYFEIRYRDKGQDQDSPDNIYPLYQLLCNRGAYNSDFIYLTRNEAGYELLSFAEPKLDYDYTDENFTRLRAPPKVMGFRTTTELGNAEFDPANKSISMRFKWRGLGDAWSSGQWVFAEGEFLLKEFNVDPTYDADDGDADEAAQPGSYRVYPPLKIDSKK
jgi:hypothetical protein